VLDVCPAHFAADEAAADELAPSTCTNIYSTGRGLFALFLFSDVTLNDAPMGMLPGSHLLAG
jgi:hypothetical protein